ncbi:MAG: PAS domain S-box protein, partial [Desulfobacula sp.]|nr:PAS domain S-box protein [Desulfobacula sp.]
IIYTQKKALEQSSLQRLENAAKMLSQVMEAQSQVLTALENIMLGNVGLSKDLQKHDRNALFSNHKDIFERLKKDNIITHFSFHLPDRVNLVRLHRKEKYGDIIDRFTLFDAIQTEKPASGIELGSLGTLTLRVVQPVFLNNLLVGYIELGNEMEDIFNTIHKEPGIEIAIGINKDRLTQSKWETGMTMLGRQADWNRFLKKVLVYTSFPKFPVQWEHFLTDKKHEHYTINTTIEYNDKSWHVLAMDIADASGSEIGDMLIFVDISKNLIQYQLFTALVAVTAFMLLGIILYSISRVLQNTDRVIFKQQKSIEKSENRFRDLFNSITDLIYTQDLNGNFTSVNPAMNRLFGYDIDEFIGFNATQFMAPEFLKEFKSRYLDVVTQQGFCEGVSYYYKKNKEKIFIEYKSSLVEPDVGEPYISGMGRDVTEKIQSQQKVEDLQEQIIQSQKMESIGTLAGGIAHDFNNILFPVMGHTEMLLNDFPEESYAHKKLKKIYSGALRARDLVKQILDFSRQEKGETRLMEIHPVLKEALKLMDSSISGNIKIIQDINKDCRPIKGDPTKIHQIIMNLITNACDAMDETGGKLTIGLKEIELGQSDLVNPDMHQGTYARFSISDTGAGIDSQLISKIFDPFFTTKEKGKGTGMGMTVVHGIVIGMGGGIKVESEIGKGTSIHVYLPAIQSEIKPKYDYDNTALTGGSEHILLVDDEEAITIMGKELLESLGYKVTTRTSSIEALEVF